MNSWAAETYPWISADGLALIFASQRDSLFVYRLYGTVRNSSAGQFATPVPIAVSTAGQTFAAALTFDPPGAELWFSSNDDGDAGSSSPAFRIYRARYDLNDAGTGPASLVDLGGDYGDGGHAADGGNGFAIDLGPVFSADDLTVYFASIRPGGLGSFDVWVAHRPNVGTPFEPPRLVPEVSSSSDDQPGWISADDCRLYLSSKRFGSHDLFVAERGK